MKWHSVHVPVLLLSGGCLTNKRELRQKGTTRVLCVSGAGCGGISHKHSRFTRAREWLRACRANALSWSNSISSTGSR